MRKQTNKESSSFHFQLHFAFRIVLFAETKCATVLLLSRSSFLTTRKRFYLHLFELYKMRLYDSASESLDHLTTFKNYRCAAFLFIYINTSFVVETLLSKKDMTQRRNDSFFPILSEELNCFG